MNIMIKSLLKAGEVIGTFLQAILVQISFYCLARETSNFSKQVYHDLQIRSNVYISMGSLEE